MSYYESEYLSDAIKRECPFNTDDGSNYRCSWEDLVEGYDCCRAV